MKQTKENNGYGIASLATSIVGLVGVMMPYFAIIFSILGVAFASIQNKTQKTGLATAGLTVGIIGIVFNSLMLLFLVFYLALFGI